MPVVSKQVHPRSLDFCNQRKVVLLRDLHEESWESIAEQVLNLQGEAPTWKTCANVYQEFSNASGFRKYHYDQCGRKAWVMTPDVQAFVLRRLLALRHSSVCTSSVLQREVAREFGITVSQRQVRRTLNKRGYHWLPKSQKKKLPRRVYREFTARGER